MTKTENEKPSFGPPGSNVGKELMCHYCSCVRPVFSEIFKENNEDCFKFMCRPCWMARAKPHKDNCVCKDCQDKAMKVLRGEDPKPYSIQLTDIHACASHIDATFMVPSELMANPEDREIVEKFLRLMNANQLVSHGAPLYRCQESDNYAFYIKLK